MRHHPLSPIDTAPKKTLARPRLVFPSRSDNGTCRQPLCMVPLPRRLPGHSRTSWLQTIQPSRITCFSHAHHGVSQQQTTYRHHHTCRCKSLSISLLLAPLVFLLVARLLPTAPRRRLVLFSSSSSFSCTHVSSPFPCLAFLSSYMLRQAHGLRNVPSKGRALLTEEASSRTILTVVPPLG